VVCEGVEALGAVQSARFYAATQTSLAVAQCPEANEPHCDHRATWRHWRARESEPEAISGFLPRALTVLGVAGSVPLDGASKAAAA